MAKRKVCFLSLAFLMGIAAAEYQQFLLRPILLLYGLIWMISIEKEYGKTIKTVFWIVLFLLAVGGGIYDSCRKQSDFKAYESLLEEGKKCLVQGEIYQKEKKEEQDLFCFYLKNCYVQFGHTSYSCNQILLHLTAEEYAIGEILCVEGNIKTFARPVNEGNYDEKKYYRSLNIDFCVDGETVLLVKGQKNRLKESLFALREKLKKSYQKAMPKKDAGVLSAMVSGDKSLMDTRRKNMYQNAGISHFYSISGLHISMIGMVVSHLIRTGIGSYFFSGVIGVAFILGYGALIGFSISASRAIGMFLILLYAKYRGRTYDRMTAAALMAAMLAGRNPGILHHAGYLLSFGAVCGVILAEELMQDIRAVSSGHPFMHGKNVQIKETPSGHSFMHGKNVQIKENMKEMLCVSICIQLVTVPVMCQFFYEISTYAVWINMVILPCMGVLLGFGIAGGMIGCAAPFAGRMLLYPCHLILLLFDRVCEGAAKLPQSSLITGKLSVEILLLWYGLLFLLLTIRKKKKAPILFFLLPFGLLFWGPKQNMFEIDILDVGQGDGIYISTGDHTSVFIDGGSTDVSKAGTYRILPFLKCRGIRKMDYWFVSHCDADHINGLCELIEADYEIQSLVVSAYMPEDDAWRELKNLAEEKEIAILKMKPKDAVKGENGTWQIACLAPAQQNQKADRNEHSMALLLQHPDCVAFFGGDMGEEEEQKLVKENELPKADVYKASHHGSDTSNSRELLNVLQPEIAVISCSMKNRYGHPGKGTVERLEEAGSCIYETRYLGQIKILGENLEVKGFSMLE